jgi:hypothetical protein
MAESSFTGVDRGNLSVFLPADRAASFGSCSAGDEERPISDSCLVPFANFACSILSICADLSRVRSRGLEVDRY